MINFIHTHLKKFIAQNKAIAIPMVAMFAFAVVSVTTTGIDVNQFVRVKSSLQAAADQAVISAVTFPKTEQVAACRRIFNTAVTESGLSKSVVSSDISCSHEDIQNRDGETVQAVVISGSAEVKTFFSNQIGLGTFTAEVAASATGETNNVELVFALSVQGTMCATTTRTTGSGGNNTIALREDASCRKFELAKDSINYAMDVLGSKFQPGQLQVGVIPYNYKVKFPNTNSIPLSLTNDEIDPNFFNDLTDADPLPEMIPLTTNLADVKARVTAMSTEFTTQAWGRSDLGMHTAYLMLDPSQRNHFGNHQPDTFDSNSKKYVVLLSDGANIGCCFSNNPNGNFDNQYIYSYEPYNDHMLAVCETLKAEGVKIFTILMDVELEDAGGEVINNVMARCASGRYTNPLEEADPNANLKCENKYACYNIADKEDLDDAYAEIISTIYKPSLDR